MPWFAREAFHGNSRTLGLLVGAAGFGAVSAWSISPRGRYPRAAAAPPDDGGLAGAALVVFSFSEDALARAAGAVLWSA